MAPVSDIATKHNVQDMFYADDSQLYVTFDAKSANTHSLRTLESCVSDIKKWMLSNMLMLNDGKTEVIIFGSRHNMQLVPSIDVVVGDCTIKSVCSVRNLGAYFDSQMSMQEFVDNKCKSVQSQIRKIYCIRKYLTKESCISLVQGLVTSKLDYANGLLAGINKSLIHKLQILQNSAARVIMQARKFDHTTEIRRQLKYTGYQSRKE